MGRDLVGGLVGIGWLLLCLFLFCLVVRGSLILNVRKRGEFPQITAGTLGLWVVMLPVVGVLLLVIIVLVALILVMGGALDLL